MKFVYNEAKNEEMRHILMMQPTIEEAKAKVDKDDTDARALYEYGTALGNAGRYEEAIEVYSQGIAFDPFYAPNYFGRGRKLNTTGHFWQAVADFTVAIHLDSDCWTYWYYRATTLNLAGHIEESIDDFRQCMKLSNPAEHYPLIHWIYTSYVELGKFDEAEKCLDLIDATVEPPKMDYGYCRVVRLYKGLVKPEEFIEPDMKDKVLPRENRVNLEKNGMYYGLYCYWTLHGEPEKAADALRELMKVAYPGAFGYTKGLAAAKKLGIVKE
ncbi:MAG TPA: hypothetical protein H9773_01320 [Candidatus Fournierella merdavium]|nr:hypothetical protein [Candidatus Fournierella merdavium]